METYPNLRNNGLITMYFFCSTVETQLTRHSVIRHRSLSKKKKIGNEANSINSLQYLMKRKKIVSKILNMR